MEGPLLGECELDFLAVGDAETGCAEGGACGRAMGGGIGPTVVVGGCAGVAFGFGFGLGGEEDLGAAEGGFPVAADERG